MLRVLLTETDEKTFLTLKEIVLETLYNDPDTAEFASYLDTYYLKNPHLWAYCYRNHAGLNTNMHLERMHKTLKYAYLKGGGM